MGELSQDAGGMIREWTSELIKAFQSPQIGLFERCDTPKITYRIKESSCFIPQFRELFHLLGLVVGKALFDRIPLNLCFSKTMYKFLKSRTFEVDDIESLDQSVFFQIIS